MRIMRQHKKFKKCFNSALKVLRTFQVVSACVRVGGSVSPSVCACVFGSSVDIQHGHQPVTAGVSRLRMSIEELVNSAETDGKS